MSDSNAPTATPFSSFGELREESAQARVLELIADQGAPTAEAFIVVEDESPGFSFLKAHGARAIQAFKLLEVALTQIGNEAGTGDLSESEWALLQKMLGADFVPEAAAAYADCRTRTHDLQQMHDLDELAAWRLTEVIQLFENVMVYGTRTGRLTREQGPRVLTLIIHDFGEYFGLLCDDVSDSRRATTVRLAQYLSQFKASKLYKGKMPVDRMTRLPISNDTARALLDFEIARGIAPHPLNVKERSIRGDEQGKLDKDDPVEFVTHKIDVRYARELGAKDVALINAILPVFAVSTFDGFTSFQEVEAYIARRQEEIETQERQCFALLQCLKHYEGSIPLRMKEFDANAVMKAAQGVYRDRTKAAAEVKVSSTFKAILKDTVSGVFQGVARPVVFTWPEDRTMYAIPGYPDTVRFFPQHAAIEVAGSKEEYTFLCHTHADVDPHGDKPMMYEYQAIIGEGLLFDAHAASRDLFTNAPAMFTRTLDIGPLVLFAKDVVHPGERGGEVDMEETKLLATYLALHGGMQSWLGQRYVLSDEGADIFVAYPDVRTYVSKL